MYENNCAQCHSAQGAGMPAASGGGPPLRGNALVVAPDPTNVVRATVTGLPAHFGRTPMPSQLNGVTARQLADIINYIRTSWGNSVCMAYCSPSPLMRALSRARRAPLSLTQCPRSSARRCLRHGLPRPQARAASLRACRIGHNARRAHRFVCAREQRGGPHAERRAPRGPSQRFFENRAA